MSLRGTTLALALLVLVALAPPRADAKRIFVPRQHRRLQAAIDAAAAGDTIWVGPGTYFGPFTIKKRLVLFGDEGPDKTVLDGRDTVRVVHVEGVTGAAIVGFTIQNGKAPGGSGIYCLRDTFFTIANCTVRSNWEAGVALWKCGATQFGDCEINGNHGGGLTASESVVSLLKTNFRDNHNSTGGGVSLVGTELRIARDCLFESNRADGGTGGGIFAESSPIRLLNCAFRGNSAASGGGAVAVMDSSDLRIRATMFSQNRSNSGGAVLTDQSYLDVQNSIFDRNRATAAASALQILGRRTAGVNPVVVSNTFYRNGVDVEEGAAIFAENVAPLITHDIFVIDSTAKNKAVLEMNGSAHYECNMVQLLDGPQTPPNANTIVGNPSFCDPEHGDFHVRALSPAILSPCGRIGALDKGCEIFHLVPSQ
jgi:parallel beta-helix repeat protein